MQEKLKKYYWVVYLIFTLTVILPWLFPGYILALDLVFTPIIKTPQSLALDAPWFWILSKINLVIPSQILEKILLFLTLYLGMIGTHRLVKPKYYWIKFFAGFLYIFNPFFYSRLGLGQLSFLLSYSLFPWVVYYLLLICEKFDLKRFLKLVLMSNFIFLIYPRSGLIIGLAILIFLLVKFLYQGVKYGSLKSILYFVILLALLIIFNNKAVLEFVRELSVSLNSSFTIDIRHLEMFKTVRDEKFGLFYNLAALYGFWGDTQGRYQIMKQMTPLWYLLIIPFWVVVVLGIINLWKKINWLVIAWVSLIFIAFIISLGISWLPLKGIYLYLIDHNFLFYALREPQKYLSLVILGFCYFGSSGFDWLLDRFKSKFTVFVFVSFFATVLPILYTPGMFWGLSGQLKPVDYPQSWYELDQYFNSEKKDFNLLFLPWHQYLPFYFNNSRIMQNPAPYFFTRQTFSGDNLEISEVYTQSRNPDTNYISGLIQNINISDLGEKLKKLNIEYVILAKEADWEEYGFLDQQKDLEVKVNNDQLRVYKNLAF